jgi:putative redox protein
MQKCIIEFQTTQLHAEYYPLSPKLDNRPLVIICHGFSGDKYEWGRFPRTAEQMNEAGFDAIYFDFSGSGENLRESITLTKQIRDLEQVAMWGQNQGYSRIVTIGLSFGGITSLLAKIPARKVAVFWAPAFYMVRIFKKKFGSFGYKIVKWILNHKKTPFKLQTKKEPIFMDKTFIDAIETHLADPILKEFTLPSLIIQGTEDSAVLPAWTQEAFSKMPQNERHKYITVDGATHDFEGVHLEQFIQESISWIKKFI